MPGASPSAPMARADCLGAACGGIYKPVAEVQASLWLCRRELFAEVGPWRLAGTAGPSPRRIGCSAPGGRGNASLPPIASRCVAVHASYYRDCYREEGSAAHEELLAAWRTNPISGKRNSPPRPSTPWKGKRSCAFCRIWRDWRAPSRLPACCLTLGIPPILAKYRLTSVRRGAYLDRIRRSAGWTSRSGAKNDRAGHRCRRLHRLKPGRRPAAPRG